MKLYGYARSSASYRVRIALGLKGLAFTTEVVSLAKDEQHAEAFRERNPMRQVPILELEHGGRRVSLTQSVAILEYLEERFPDPPLLPKDTLLRAFVRRAVEIVNSGVQPLQNLSLMNEVKRLGGDATRMAKAANERGLQALDAVTSEVGGAYLVGDDVTLADVCLVPQMFSARRFGVDLSPFGRLVAIDEALAAMPAVAAAHPDRQPDAAA